jgi:hypothetical protein
VATATSLAGGTVSAPKIASFSLRIVAPTVSAGTVTSSSASSLSDTGATWVQGQFNGSNGMFYAEFDSGMEADISQTTASTKTLTLVGPLPAVIPTGAAYRIRRHLTLASVFGAYDESGLMAGSNSAQADNVLLHSPDTQQTHTYFYSNVPGFSGWYRDDYTPAANVMIYPAQGILVRRKSALNVALYLVGVAKEGPMLTPVLTGLNLMGTLKSSRALKLSELNLYTHDVLTGLASGSNPGSADNLVVINPDASTSTHFYSDYPGFEGWYDNAFLPSGNLMVLPGSAFFINRKGPHPSFFWSIPAE